MRGRYAQIADHFIFMNSSFRPMWILRFFFPLLFIVLVSIQYIDFSQDYIPLQEMTLFDWLLLGLEIFILYKMLFLFTVRYKITDDMLIVQSFLFREKHFMISKILFIEEEGMFSKFSRAGLGPDWATIHFEGNKKLHVFGLSDHYKFIRLLKGNAA